MPPVRQNYGAPTLPRALLDQVDGSSGPKRKQNGVYNRSAPTTRKDKRKLEREQQRSNRSQTTKQTSRKQFSRPPQRTSGNDGHDEDDEDNDDQEDTPPAPAATASQPSEKSNDSTKLKSILKRPASKPASAIANSKTSAEITQRPLSRREKEKIAEDDAEIAALEKRLGIKSKKLPKSFAEDGLDTLLGELDGAENYNTAPRGKRKRAEDVAWLERKRRKIPEEIASGSEEEDKSADDEETENLAMGMDERLEVGSSAESDDEEEDNNGDEENNSVESVEDGGDSLHSSEYEEDDFEDFDSEVSDQAPSARVRENPYIAPGAEKEKQPSRYIPPSLRAAPSSDAEIAVRLRRQVQGLLNRLSEANLVSILGDVEQLYQSNPRQYVTSTLIDLLLGLICDRTVLNDTFIILHAGFIAAVYKAVGSDFGAQIIERVVSKFDECYGSGLADETSGKESINLVSLLAQLYNLQVIGSELVFDYVRGFLDELSEAHTELLLRVVRSSGSQLRQDDPSSLKDIVLLLQKTVSKSGEATLSVRTKFMMETINDLKNNKLKAGAATSAVTLEHLTRMRRILGSLNTRSIKGSEPLRIGLADIRDTEKRGKWWLVGASWKGKADEQPLPSHSSSTASITTTSKPSTTPTPDDVEISTDLLSLARAARMNTDIRRAIFITLMSASDCADAHLRLQKLSLKRSQETEIPKVVLHCAGAERTYNPYYTLIASKLCGEHRMRMGFQFALWDLFRKMGERGGEEDEGEGEEEEEGVSMAALVNYGKMFGNLIAGGRLGLNVLKNLDLLYLQPSTKSFVEVLFVTLFLACATPSSTKHKTASKKPVTAQSIMAVFAPALEFPGLKAGLLWFLRKVVVKTDLVASEAERVKVKGAVKDALDVLATGGI